LAWLGLAWLGLAWLGLAWLGLAWLGLELSKGVTCFVYLVLMRIFLEITVLTALYINN
jgi:hypothetical protein